MRAAVRILPDPWPPVYPIRASVFCLSHAENSTAILSRKIRAKKARAVPVAPGVTHVSSTISNPTSPSEYVSAAVSASGSDEYFCRIKSTNFQGSTSNTLPFLFGIASNVWENRQP